MVVVRERATSRDVAPSIFLQKGCALHQQCCDIVSVTLDTQPLTLFLMDCSSAIMETDYDEMLDQSSDTLSNADDEDISIIEYARYYGLSKDYTTFDPLSPHILHSIPAWEHLDLDITQLPQFKLPDRIDLDEKWTIDLQTAVFLKQIASLEVAPFPEITRHRSISAEYKTEPLLLTTDPELEQRRFIRARNSRLNRASQEVSSEALWQDDQEASLYWPKSDLPTTLIEQIKNERLQLDKNDIIFLQQCISVPEKPDLQDIDVSPHKRVSLCESVVQDIQLTRVGKARVRRRETYIATFAMFFSIPIQYPGLACQPHTIGNKSNRSCPGRDRQDREYHGPGRRFLARRAVRYFSFRHRVH
jgi:hypothetical protein